MVIANHSNQYKIFHTIEVFCIMIGMNLRSFRLDSMVGAHGGACGAFAPPLFQEEKCESS